MIEDRVDLPRPCLFTDLESCVAAAEGTHAWSSDIAPSSFRPSEAAPKEYSCTTLSRREVFEHLYNSQGGSGPAILGVVGKHTWRWSKRYEFWSGSRPRPHWIVVRGVDIHMTNLQGNSPQRVIFNFLCHIGLNP